MSTEPDVSTKQAIVAGVSLVAFFVAALWWLSTVHWAEGSLSDRVVAAAFFAFIAWCIFFWIVSWIAGLPEQRRRREQERVAAIELGQRLAEQRAADESYKRELAEWRRREMDRVRAEQAFAQEAAQRIVARSTGSGGVDRGGAPRIGTWREAERFVAVWLEVAGFQGTRLTGRGTDAGVDVEATGMVAQVKRHSRPIGRPDVQRLIGAALAHGANTKALFFSSSGFTTQAVEFAAGKVALFTFDDAGRVTPINTLARPIASRATRAARELVSEALAAPPPPEPKPEPPAGYAKPKPRRYSGSYRHRTAYNRRRYPR